MYNQIGTIQKVKGTEGAMIVQLDYGGIFLSSKVIWIYQHYTYVPYEVESWEQLGKNCGILHIASITNRTEALQLRNGTVFVAGEEAKEMLAHTSFRLIGFVIIDVNEGVVGKVTGIMQNVAQALLQVDYKGNELLIPINDIFIQDIKKEKQTITTMLPSGYLASLVPR